MVKEKKKVFIDFFENPNQSIDVKYLNKN